MACTGCQWTGLRSETRERRVDPKDVDGGDYTDHFEYFCPDCGEDVKEQDNG
jgi:hypothetical protein